MDDILRIEQRLAAVLPLLDERSRRLVAASEAIALGSGGVSLVSRASGLSRKAIAKGMSEVRSGHVLPAGRVRREGAGRKKTTVRDPQIARSLEAIIEPGTRGDPETPLRWTLKSTRTIANALSQSGHQISHAKVGQLLRDQGYSLQGNRKTEEGVNHQDRDKQFRYINRLVSKRMKAGQPVISVDTKKKELLGNYVNSGEQWLPAKNPKKVNGHDFPHPDIPRAFPYGIYDIDKNKGFVNVGTDHDTGEFAVASIRGWWRAEGCRIYPKATSLLITADGGGSNGYRLRLWKVELQKLADELGLSISVCHFPPGTSKWNKVEHRLFSFISSNWRGEPLLDYETVVKLISNTKTATGLSVKCRLDRRKYEVGRKISNADMKTVNLEPQKFHGEWNYIIHPRMPS